MGDPPYRPVPAASETDGALAQLAAQGQRRIAQASAARTAAESAAELKKAREDAEGAETNVRVALGACYAGPLRKARPYLLMVVAAGVTTMAGVSNLVPTPVVGPIFFLGGLVFVGGVLWAVLARPTASRAEVAAEKAWASSLPFALEGYFDMLAEDPVKECQLVMQLAWQPGRVPTPDVVQGVLGLWDPGAMVHAGDDGALGIRSSRFVSGKFVVTNNADGQGFVRPTRDLVERVHRLVDAVLLPLHRSYPMARVSLTRHAGSPP